MNLPVKQAPTAPAAPRPRLSFDLMDPVAFDHIQRIAGLYAKSPLFPAHLRSGDYSAALANAVLVMNIAERLREDPLTVAQNIYFVGGKPGWSASYMISKANQHGVFKDPIDWEVKSSGEDLSVSAFAVLVGTGKKVSVTIGMDTARKEGWTKNSKYQSMPEQMLKYRTATALIRLYCPEVMIGVPPANEVEDENYAMRDITPAADYAPMNLPPELAQPQREVKPEQEKPKRTRKPVDRTPPPAAEKPQTEPDHDPETGEVVEADASTSGDDLPPEYTGEGNEPEQGDMLAGQDQEPPKTQAKGRDWSKFLRAFGRDVLAVDESDLGEVVEFYRKELVELQAEDPAALEAFEKENSVSITPLLK